MNKANKLQDQFRGRAHVPDLRQRGDAGRASAGARSATSGPKYKNSPETPIYQKSRLLYGLNWAKAEIVARGEVVICEGYTDVMAFALAGVAERGRDLRHRARRRPLPDPEEPRPQGRSLAYDSDAAGQAAAERWYEWEQRYEIQFAGRRPPRRSRPRRRLARRPAALRAARSSARRRSSSSASTACSRPPTCRRSKVARAPARRAAAIVAEHPSDLVRDQYVMKLAGRLDIDADRLREHGDAPPT